MEDRSQITESRFSIYRGYRLLFRHASYGKERQTLIHFLTDTYADLRFPEDIAAGIHKLLIEKDLLPSTFGLSINMGRRLYKADISVFRGSKGRKTAFSLLLDFLESQKTPQTLSVLDAQGFSWIFEDPKYGRGIMTQLGRILDAGHQMRILLHAHKSHDVYRLYWDWAFHAALREPRVHVQTVTLSGLDVLPSLYMVDPSLAFSSSVLEDGTIYSSVMTDGFSVNRDMSTYNKLWAYSRPLFTPLHVSSIQEPTYHKMLSVPGLDPFYLFTSSLPVALMERECLLETLLQNECSDRQQARALEYYDMWRHQLDELRTEGTLQVFVPALKLFEAMQESASLHEELTLFCGKEIYMRREQLARQLLHAAEMLRVSALSYQLCLTPRRLAHTHFDPGSLSQMLFYKKNAFAGYAHPKAGDIRYTADVSFLETADESMALYLDSLTADMKSRNYTADLLREIAGSDPLD